MEDRTINVLLTSFPGLGLPQTLSLPTKASTSVAELTWTIRSRLPSVQSRLLLTTSRNKLLEPSSQVPLSSLLPENDTILPLRLSVPLCGGKGGFGSQLRAAGGRMSSRKKKSGDQNGSSRNLDGRRLRTIKEAKDLAEYLVIKPEMDRKQKELRRQRCEQILQSAERRAEEIKNGSKGRIDGQWVEDKDEAGERTREAVKAAMASGDYKDLKFSKLDVSASSSEEEEQNHESNEESGSVASAPTSPEDTTSKEKGKAKEVSQKFFGWDEDDEFMSDDSDDNEGQEIADK